MSEHTVGESAPLLLADSLALDFINTQYGVEPLHRELLTSDRSVADWLRAAGALPVEPERLPRGLLPLARKLRASARALLEAGQAGAWGDPALVNQVLERGSRPLELQWDARVEGFRQVKRLAPLDAPGLLFPVAEDLMRLLTEADLSLVRQCEGDNCTLLFHDVTKSHRRRWCSMAGCGNRMKVAAFRARRKSA